MSAGGRMAADVDAWESATPAECAAWRQAYRVAQAHPKARVTVWRSRGEWLVLKAGEAPPSRAVCYGTVHSPDGTAIEPLP